MFSIGLHPWFIEPGKAEDSLTVVRNCAALDSCLAIGETGLDKLTKTPFDIQMSVFKSHIQIAEELHKPLIIHCVRAYREMIEVKKNTKSEIPWIIHGFNSAPGIAVELITHGMILSFGKALVQADSNSCKTLGIIPHDRFFLETDDSDISISAIYDYASKLLKTGLPELQKIIKNNFNKTFGAEYE